jgi:tetratricopeptide (TPR) repeat protein
MRHSRLIIVFFLIILPLTVFWQTQYHGFVWDDTVNVKENRYLRPVSLTNVLRFWQRPYEDLYIPLTYSIWSGIAGVSGNVEGARAAADLQPRPFHIANWLVHLCTTLVVFIILNLLVKNDWAAAGGALLFGLHPLQVEAVSWVTGMKDLLSGLLSIVAAWQYLDYVAASQAASGSPRRRATQRRAIESIKYRRRHLHYVLATVAFFLALLAKPSAVTLPLIVWFLDCWVIGRSARASLFTSLPWVGLSVLFIVLTKLSQPDVYIDFVPPLLGRPLIVLDALGFYLYKLVLPIGLNIDYGRSARWVFEQGWMYLFWLFPCVLPVLIWWCRNRIPWLVAAAGVFVAGMLAVSGLVPFGFQNVSTVADRYVYVSMLGPALGFACLLAQYQAIQVKLACGVILAFLAVMSFQQTQYWASDRTLAGRALDHNPKSWVAHVNLGSALAEQHKNDEAIAHFQESLRLNPQFNLARVNLGNVLANEKKLDEAIVVYREATRLSPRYADAHKRLANALFMRGDLTEAREHYLTAVRFEPQGADTHFNLALTLAQLGEVPAAIDQLREAIAINPLHAKAHYNLGTLLGKQERLDEAANQFRAAITIDPTYAKAYYNLGMIAAMRGRHDEAVAYLRHTVRLDPDFSQAHYWLDQALAKERNQSPVPTIGQTPQEMVTSQKEELLTR